MPNNMPGVALCEVRGLLSELLERLSGENAVEWLGALKKFLRKENPWQPDGYRVFMIGSSRESKLQLGKMFNLPIPPFPGMIVTDCDGGIEIVVQEVRIRQDPEGVQGQEPPAYITLFIESPSDEDFWRLIKDAGWEPENKL